MKTQILILSFLFLCKINFSQTVIKDYPIITSDGDSLATDIYIPKGKGPFPTILMRTPYDKKLRNYGTIFNDKGYAFIVQDVRGRVASSGVFKAWIDEELDGYETLEWIIKQQWSNGDIGLVGSSYSGYAAMQLAASKHPSIKAVVNNSGPTDLYDVVFPGGVFHNTALLPWSIAFTQHNGFNFPPYKSGLSMNDLAREKPLNNAFKKNGYQGVFWNYLLNHQTKDSYWNTLNVSNVDKINIPILHITGWFDFISTSAIDGYLKIVEGQKKRGYPINQELHIGPWIHDDMMNGRTKVGEIDYGDDVKVGLESFLNTSINFFDKHMKYNNGASKNIDKIKYFDIGSKKWNVEKEWPSTRDLVYYLNFDENSKRRTLDKEMFSNSKDTYVFNPDNPVETLGGANIHFPFFGDTNGIRKQNSIQNRSDILVYTSNPLTQDIQVFGKIKAKLYVSTTANDADFTVKINQVHPDGTITNLRDGIQRLSLAKTLAYKSFISSGGIEEVEVDLGYISALIPKGYSINIQISSSNYPKFSLNPGNKENALTTNEFIKAEQTIYSSSTYKSSIQIPIKN